MRSRFYGQLHNRWRFLLKHYQWRTLFLIAPVLLIYEFLLAGVLLATGVGGEYGRAVRDVAADCPRIMRQRRQVQTMRRVADPYLLSADRLSAPRQLLEHKMVRGALGVLSTCLRLYWALVCPLLRWRGAPTAGHPYGGSARRPSDQTRAGSAGSSAPATGAAKSSQHAP